MNTQPPLSDLKQTIDTINKQITGVNTTLESYSQEIKKNPVLLQRQTEALKKQLEEVSQTSKPNQEQKEDKEENNEKEKEDEKKKIAIKKDKEDGKDYSVTQGWGDPRYNPNFLKAAEYFGLKEGDYINAYSKINHIIDWAANETKSRDMSDILAKIGSTSRELQSPGFSEKRYAILYRYIKLANLERTARSEEEKEKIRKEISAYKA